MKPAAADDLAGIEWGWAGRPLEGLVSGDACLVTPHRHGVLIAVIDGLGHGPDAAEAASLAVDVLRAVQSSDVLDLIRRCHEALRATRGAAMSVALIGRDLPVLTWAGVGNVEGELFRGGGPTPRTRHAMSPRGGVVGYQIPPLRADSLPISEGDVLVMATDGIRSDFAERLALDRGCQEIADGVLARSGKATDDALVLVARYRGEP